jgi:hypothetical protein
MINKNVNYIKIHLAIVTLLIGSHLVVVPTYIALLVQRAHQFRFNQSTTIFSSSSCHAIDTNADRRVEAVDISSGSGSHVLCLPTIAEHLFNIVN